MWSAAPRSRGGTLPAPTVQRVDFSDGRRSRRADRGMVDRWTWAPDGERLRCARRRARRWLRRGDSGQGAPPQDDLLRGGCPARSSGGRCGGHGGVLHGAILSCPWATRTPKRRWRLPRARPVRCSPPISPRTRRLPPLTRPTSPMRIDEGARTLTFISLPPSVSVELSDGSATPRRRVRWAATRAAGYGSLLRGSVRPSRPPMPGASPPGRSGGGVPVELSEEVDDPRAGIHVVCWPPGPDARQRPGAHALRGAANYSVQWERRRRCEALFTVNLAERATSGEGSFFPERDSRRRALRLHGLDERPAHFLGHSAPSRKRRYAAVVPGALRLPTRARKPTRCPTRICHAMMEAVNAGKCGELLEGNLPMSIAASSPWRCATAAAFRGAAARRGELLTRRATT